MADNLRKYTTQEVLNKVYTDSSGDTIGLQAQTSKETLNAVLNTSTNSLNVSLSGSNTISGDVTITGDLTVQGNGSGNYDEIIEGNLILTSGSKLGVGTGDAVLSDDVHVVNSDNVYLQLESSNASTTKESAIKYSNFSTGSNFWWAGLNQSDDYSLAYGTSFSGSNTMFLVTETGNIGVGTTTPKHYSGTSGTVLSIHNSSYRGVLELSGASNSDDGVIGAITFANTENAVDNGALAQMYTYVETSDSNDGNDSGGHLAFLTKPEAGSIIERMRINSDGTTRFSYDASVESYGGNFTVKSLNGSDGDATLVLISDAGAANEDTWRINAEGSNNNLDFLNHTNTRMTLTSGGSLGIGESSPDELLHLKSSTDAKPIIKIEQSGNNANGGGLIFLTSGTANDNDDSGVIRFKGMNDAGTPEEIEYATIYVNHDDVSDGSEDGTMHFRTQSGGSLDSRLIIKGNKVGVGINPDFPLHVSGATSTNGGSRRNVVIVDNTSAAQGTGGGISLGGFYNGTSDLVYEFATIQGIKETGGQGNYAGALTFATRANGEATQEQMRIDSSGNVGIGTAPDSNTPLHIQDATYGRVRIESTGSNSFAILYLKNDAIEYAVRTNGSDAFEVRDDTAGAVRLSLDSNSRISLSNNDGNSANSVFGKNAFTNAGTVLGNVGADHNTVVGEDAMGTGTTTDATNNSAIGYKGLEDITSGDGNVSLGSWSASSITTGSSNVAIGGYDGTTTAAMRLSTTVNRCVIIGTGAGSAAMTTNGGASIPSYADGTVGIGYKALTSLTSGDENVAVGYEALKTTATGEHNTAVGFQALKSATDGGDNNTAIGRKALTSVSGSSGDGNTAVGSNSGLDLVGGYNNTSVGYSAGSNLTGGNSCTALGYNADYSGTGAVNETVIGSGATGQADNSVTLGNADVTKLYIAPDCGTSATQSIVFKDTGGEQGQVVYDHGNEQFQFYVGGAIKARIESGGAIYLDGGGIKFPASQVAHADANTMDDYEEGEYNPTLTGSSSGSLGMNTSFDTLSYTKIGRQCTVTGMLHITSDSSLNGELNISLPFAVAGTTETSDNSVGACGFAGIGSAINGTPVVRCAGGTQYADIMVTPNDGGSTFQLTHDYLDSNFYLFITASFITA